MEMKRELSLRDPLGHRRFLSAASDLVFSERYAYVIADDEFSMGIFDLRTQEPGWSTPLLPGYLPEDPVERKKLKPDLEACLLLEEGDNTVKLLALPSGSKKIRSQGAWIKFENEGSSPSASQPVDFSELYRELKESIVELNIEGASRFGETLVLLHRGNDPGSRNAVIVLDRTIFTREVDEGKIGPRSIRRIVPVEIGEISGVRLTFTSAAFDPQGRLWFLAAAEATDSTYNDGDFMGAVLGRLDDSLTHMEYQERLEIPFKPEGLAFDPANPRGFYVVTDADDATRRAGLYSGRLE